MTQLLRTVPDASGLSDDPKESMKLSDPAPLSRTGHPEEEHKTVFPTTSDFLSVGTEGPPKTLAFVFCFHWHGATSILLINYQHLSDGHSQTSRPGLNF